MSSKLYQHNLKIISDSGHRCDRCSFLFYIRLPKTKRMLPVRCCVLFIITGAIGNLIDRVRLGFVVDYFDFRFIWEYVFNIADVYVVIGTILLCIYILFIEGKEQVK